MAAPEGIRTYTEHATGSALGDVRLHTDDRAAILAASLRADAFTVGRDVYFASGAYAPERPQGRRLLAHELAHVALGHGDVAIHRQPTSTFTPNPCHGTARLPGDLDYPGTLEHLLIEQYYVSKLNPSAETEYLIPRSGRSGGNGYADIVDPVGGGIYEIKFYGVVDRAFSDLKRYVPNAEKYCDPHTTWHRGEFYPPKTLDFTSDQELVTWLYAPGVIAYFLRKKQRKPDRPPVVFDRVQEAEQRQAQQAEKNQAAAEGQTGATAAAKAAFVTLMVAALAKYGLTAASQFVERIAPSLALRSLALAAAEGGTLAGAGGGAAGLTAASTAVSGAEAGELLSLGSRAGIIGISAAITLLVFDAVTRYTYGNIYNGTRGASLRTAYAGLGEVSRNLARDSETADETFAEFDELGDPDAADNAKFRDFFFDVLYQLRVSIYDAGLKLATAARDFSAIADQLDESDALAMDSARRIADTIIASNSRSFSELLILYTQLQDMVRWFTKQMRRLVDGYRDVVNRDAKNWLEYRR